MRTYAMAGEMKTPMVQKKKKNKYKMKRIGSGSYLKPIWFPGNGVLLRLGGFIYNGVLMFCWLPLLIAGIRYLFVKGGILDLTPTNYYTPQMWFFFILGILFHEFGHAAAAMSYGGRFRELGIMTFHFIPGMYVKMEEDGICGRFRRIQTFAAGIEANLAWSGILMLTVKLHVFNGMALVVAAVLNMVMALLNCSILDGLDGARIFEELIGFRSENLSMFGAAFLQLWDRDIRMQLLQKGENGMATLLTAAMILVLQMGFPVLILLNAISVLQMIFTR